MAAKANPTGRRDKLRAIEVATQQLWADEKTFEANAPADKTQEKFMVTFPYPYMNGRLHLGHGFTLSKSEISAGYHSVKGHNVLYPFAFHCTGMPIQAAAVKLRNEIEKYGCPPDKVAMAADAKIAEEKANEREESKEVALPKSKAKGKKTKAGSKTKKNATQFDILKACNVNEEEIPSFVDPEHWLTYFPPRGQADLQRFGHHVDWRRSFITTSTNPYYDKFIRWQFKTLKASDKIAFGKVRSGATGGGRRWGGWQGAMVARGGEGWRWGGGGGG